MRPWWISYPAAGTPDHCPVGSRRAFSATKFVSTSSRPSPSTSAGAPSTPSGSRMTRPSIWNPPQIPSSGLPAAACSVTARSRPRDRSQARSAIVARVPGRTTRSASATAAGCEANTTSRSGSSPSASTSVKLLIRGSRTTATRRAADCAARRPCRSRASSESSQTSGCQGSVPYTRRPVTRSRSRRPGASSARSPRNLFTTNPAISS